MSKLFPDGFNEFWTILTFTSVSNHYFEIWGGPPPSQIICDGGKGKNRSDTKNWLQTNENDRLTPTGGFDPLRTQLATGPTEYNKIFLISDGNITEVLEFLTIKTYGLEGKYLKVNVL